MLISQRSIDRDRKNKAIRCFSSQSHYDDFKHKDVIESLLSHEINVDNVHYYAKVIIVNCCPNRFKNYAKFKETGLTTSYGYYTITLVDGWTITNLENFGWN